MLRLTLLLILASITVPHDAVADLRRAPNGRPFNVLFLAIDDLNNWIGCMGGHPQVKTPHLDRLASRSVLFTNAHCPAPICNPSRAALMTGLSPSTTGIYYLGPLFRRWEATRHAVTIPQHFQRHGYRSLGVGKIFHVEGPREFEEYGGKFGGFGPRPRKRLVAGPTHPLWDWGRFPEEDMQMPDAKVAAWTVAKLREKQERPFFLACGFFRPHVPLYAPKKWFDLYPLDTVQLPPVIADDLKDVPQYGRDLSWSVVAPRHRWMVENDQWKPAVQAYLASTSFVDAQVGKVLDALDASEAAENTIVVCWSDHGFHLGTKERWGKRSLWEASTQVVLMISAPGMARGVKCDRPVGLIDLFATLNDLCGLDPVTGIEGRSLVPLLKDPAAAWPFPALTTFGQHNHAVRSQNWRYIVYADGTEELYDRRKDPDEFQNLAKDPQYRKVIAEHRRWLPQVNHPMAPGSVHAGARPGSAADIDTRKKTPDNTLTRAEQEAGWVLLFDGRTLEGWMTSARQPSRRPVERGMLNPHKSGDYMLVYEKPLRDFELMLDFMIQKEQPRKTFNSGIFFRTSSLKVRPGKDVGYNGIEMAIDYDPAHPERAGYHDTGAIYDLVKPRRQTMKPPGEWNRARIRCHGPRISITLNGEVVAEMNADDWPEKLRRPDGSQHKFDTAYRDHPRRGFIGLQDHGAEIWFKNIKVLPLSRADRRALAR